MAVYNCIVCGKQFETKRRFSSYCSSGCRCKKWREDHPEHNNKWRREHPEQFHISTQKTRYKLKYETLSAYSGDPPFCTCCGETELSMLTLEHLNDDGKKHRDFIKGEGERVYYHLKKMGYPKFMNITVRCMNCNFSRKILGICAHKLKKESNGEKKEKQLTIW